VPQRDQDRVYRLCHRILGSAEAAADATRETFAPLRRGDDDFDVVRSALAACRRAGSEPEREALALRELEGLSFDEIAGLLGVDRDTVALQVVWARAPAATALPSPACERALPLLAREQDGLLDEDSNEAGWLGEHLMHCRGCRLRRDAMQPAEGPYAEHPPPVPAPPQPQASKARRRRGEAALAGVLACVFLLVLLFGPASYNEMLGSPFPKADEQEWRVGSDEPAIRPAEDPRPARGKRGGPRRPASRPREQRRTADRRRRHPDRRARRANRAERNRAADPAPPSADGKKDAPKKKRPVARGRVEHPAEPDPQEEDIVPEVTPAPAPPQPPTETAPAPTETAPAPPPPQ
jgi:Sigma-70, region 4